MSRNPVLLPLIVACALFMENLDTTVLTTSMPAIARDMGAHPIALKLALVTYLLSLAVFIPASGWVADRFGARHVFRAAVAVFTIGSILCGFSQTLTGLVAARALQGVGGAMMVPVGRLIVLRLVAKSELVNALAWISIPALIGPLIGPLVGGFITTYFHWRWIFWINVPIGVLGITLATLFIPDIKFMAPGRFDFVGLVLAGLGLAICVMGATLIGLAGVPWWVGIALLAVGGLLLVAYWRYSKRVVAPILNLELLRIDTFHAAVVGGFLFRAAMGASPFLLPLLLQVIFGLDPLQSGAITFIGAAAAMLMKFAAAPLIRRFGFRQTLVITAVIGGALAGAPAGFTAATPHIVIMTILFVGGFFRSLFFTGINALGYADIKQDRMSAATSLASVAQQVSRSVGISIGALVLELSMALRGADALSRADFVVAFLAIGLMSLASVPHFVRLRRYAGSETSGHGPRISPEAAQAGAAAVPEVPTKPVAST